MWSSKKTIIQAGVRVLAIHSQTRIASNLQGKLNSRKCIRIDEDDIYGRLLWTEM